MYEKTTGLVLRDVNYKDSGKILTVLTPGGKRTVSARGARRKGSRLTGAAQLFAYSEMEIFEYRGRYSLNEAETKELFLGLRADIENFALAAYFMELLETVMTEDEESEGALSLALNSLYALENGLRPSEQIKAVFELKLMALAGFEPVTDCCAVCGGEPKQPMLNVRQGVVHCAACRGGVGEGDAAPLCEASLSAMRYLFGSDIRRVFSFSLEAEGLRRLGNAAEAYVQGQLERSFKTLDFYKTILR